MSAPPVILLAAGASRRMGSPKALLPIEGRTALERLVETYREAGAAPIVVVASGPTLLRARDIEAILVVEGDPEAPMIDSLARALDVLPATCPGVFVQPVDAPFTSPGLLARLAAGDPGASRVPCHEGRPGHPVYVSARLFDDLRERPEGGLERVLGQREVEVVDWPEPTILADLDRPEDVAAWLRDRSPDLH